MARFEEDVVKASQTATTGGRKFDGNKLEFGLLPPKALEATVDVLLLALRSMNGIIGKEYLTQNEGTLMRYRDICGHGKVVKS